MILPGSNSGFSAPFIKLEIVETKIAEETQNLASLNQAIAAAGKGKVGEKLMAWKMKAEYKLHKLQLRKEKIDIAKLIINQSKLTQHREALITLEQGIASINMQLETAKPIEKIEKVEVTTQTADLLFTYWKKAQEPSPLSISIAQYLKDNLKIAV